MTITISQPARGHQTHVLGCQGCWNPECFATRPQAQPSKSSEDDEDSQEPKEYGKILNRESLGGSSGALLSAIFITFFHLLPVLFFGVYGAPLFFFCFDDP